MSRVVEFTSCVVYLPATYLPTRSYSIIYALHGYNGQGSDFFTKSLMKGYLDKSIKSRIFPSSIIVCINARNSWYLEPLESLFIKHFIPMFEHSFVCRCKSRSILGISMGGYGALYYSLKYPRLFQSVFAISPAIRPKPNQHVPSILTLLRLLQHIPQSQVGSVFVLCGKQDSRVKDINSLVQMIKQKDLNMSILLTPGKHDWDYFNSAIRIICYDYGSFI